MRREERYSRKLSQIYKTKPDYILLFIVVAMLSIGLLMVFSASPTMAMKLGDPYYYLKRHCLALAIGFTALYAGLKMELELLRNWSTSIALISIALLIFVLFPGVGMGIGGARRWVYFGFLSFQPGEIAKFALIVFLAKELSSKPFNSAVLPSLGATLATALLILKEPDLGTSIIITFIAFALFYLAGTPIRYMFSVLSAAIFGFLIISLTSTYRLRRLTAYINPWADPRGIGFHIIQSLIAVGSGGLFGAGLGGSKQKFLYLPQNYTDFIFAILCEEMGLFGAVGVVLLCFLYISRGLKIVRNTPDPFLTLLAGGIVTWIGFQALLNMSVVLGLLPTTGIPFPFISYGGTSIVATLFSTGVLLNISQYKLAPSGGRAA